MLTAAVFAALPFIAACGGSKTEAATENSAAVAASGAKMLRVTADDTMRFSTTTLEAKAGEALRVEFTNKGSEPKQAMAHNWVLLQPCTEAEVNSFGMAAASAAPTYLPAAEMSRVITHTKLLGPGETDAIEFNAPTQPGEYPFLCTFPGHVALMKGKLIVK